MKYKYTLNEGIESLERIRLMMSYELNKTLKENIIEQKSDFAMDRQSAALMNVAGITSDKEYKERLKDIDNTYKTKIDAPSVPELLDKAREFFFTPGGMTAQIVLSILGAEIGLPIVFEILDIAILINDFNDMVKGWKTPPNNIKTFEEWFMFQWENNRGFQKVCEDILIILTGGVIKILGKGGKEVYALFKKKFGQKGFEPVTKTVGSAIKSKKPMINRLPTQIKNWANQKVSGIEQGMRLLNTAPKEVAKGVIKKVPKAMIMGGITYASMIALEYVFKKWTEPKLDMDEIKNYLIAFNPNLINQWVKHKSKKPDEGGIYWVYARDPKGKFYIAFDKDWVPLDEKDSEDVSKLFIAERAYSKVKLDFSVIDRDEGIYKINGKKYQFVNLDGSSWKVKEI